MRRKSEEDGAGWVCSMGYESHVFAWPRSLSWQSSANIPTEKIVHEGYHHRHRLVCVTFRPYVCIAVIIFYAGKMSLSPIAVPKPGPITVPKTSLSDLIPDYHIDFWHHFSGFTVMIQTSLQSARKLPSACRFIRPTTYVTYSPL